LELDLLSVKRALAPACLGAMLVLGCAWPPLAPRITSRESAVDSQPSPSARSATPRTAPRRPALGSLMASSSGRRFVPAPTPSTSSAPTATEVPAAAAPAEHKLGTMTLSPAGAAVVRAFAMGRSARPPQGTTVLHLGDSFAGALGIALRKELESHNVKHALHFKTASFIPNWAAHAKVPLWLLRYKPDLVLITLGANELSIQDPGQRAGAIRRMVKVVAGHPCVWIVPPLWAEENGLTGVIAENCSPCRVMDTNALIAHMPRERDGIHPSTQARQDWAKLVVAWLAAERVGDAELPWRLRAAPSAAGGSSPPSSLSRAEAAR
jgi:lysophospholipase L1-like esterase